jgi:hypothetical protein
MFALASAPVAAQSTLGELLDKGGKKLSKADFMATFNGATVSGVNANGARFQGTYKADGSYTGSFQSAQGTTGGMFGTWTLDDSGKVCVELTSSGSSGRGATCGYYYKAGDTLYFSGSDTDRGAPVFTRVVNR